MTPFDVATKKNRDDAYWRFCHGFDNIQTEPKDWPIIESEK